MLKQQKFVTLVRQHKENNKLREEKNFSGLALGEKLSS